MARREVLVATLAAVIATPLAAQTLEWQNRWYWGAKAGMLGYSLPTSGVSFAPQIGGEWLITLRRTALYIGYSQSLSSEVDTFTVNNTAGTQVTFDGFRRIQISLLAMIGSGNLQPYVGGGFALHTLNGAAPPAGSSTALQDATAEASSVGILMIMGGVQYRIGRKAALFAHFQGAPGSNNFLLTGAVNSFEGGLRYALLPSKSDDATTRR